MIVAQAKVDLGLDRLPVPGLEQSQVLESALQIAVP